MNLAIVPARGGSKRIKNKNIVDFYGKPIIYYTLNSLKNSKLFDRIHVSTEDPAIKQIVEELGFPIEFPRPQNLADDQTGMTPVLKWVLNHYGQSGVHFETVCVMMPCAPLVDTDDLTRAYEIFKKNKFRNPLCSVSTYAAPVEWAFTRSADGFLTAVNPKASAYRSQDLGIKYYDSGAFYLYTADQILSSERVSALNFISYVLPRNKSVDIDEPEDLAFAEALFKIKNRN